MLTADCERCTSLAALDSDTGQVDIGYYGSATVVVLSDGENNGRPDPLEVAQMASVAGVHIHTIGIGTEAGTVVDIGGFNVATALDNFFNSGGALPPGFVSVFGLTGSNLGNALSQLSGEAATGGQQGAFQMGNQFLGLMLDPFVDGRNGAAGLGAPAIAFAPEREAVPDEIALAYAAVLKAPPVKAATFEQRWTAWGGGTRSCAPRSAPFIPRRAWPGPP